MRKLVIGALVVGIAAVAGYQFVGQEDHTDAKMEAALSAVPSDTLLLSAYLKPLDLIAYTTQMGGMNEDMLKQIQSDFAEIQADYDSTDHPDSANKVRFLAAYISEMIAVLNDNDSLENRIGYKQETRLLSYFVGMAPVIRWETADAARVIAFIEELEAEYDVVPELLTVADQSVRSYSFDFDTEQTWSVWFSTNADWTTVSLQSSAFPEAEQALLIGAAAPTNNIIADGSFEATRERYELNDESITWMPTQVLTDALSQRQQNRLGRDLRQLFPDSFSEPSIAQWSTAACQTDLQTISDRFPGFFSDMAVTENDDGNMNVAARMVVPIAHEGVMGSLQKIRGVVPDFFKQTIDDVTVGLAVGLDAGQLGPVASELWNATAQADFTCEPLVAWQQDMQQQPIGGAFAMTSMANGLLGLQVLVNHIDAAAMTAGDFSTQQMSVSASLSDVESFYSVMQASFPPLAGVNLPGIGDSIDISPVMAMGLGVPLSANMSRGSSQLTIATLDDASQQQRKRLNDTALTERGLFAFSMDYAEIGRLIEAQFTAQGQAVPDELQSFMHQDYVAGATVDFSLRGVEFTYQMKSNTKP